MPKVLVVQRFQRTNPLACGICLCLVLSWSVRMPYEDTDPLSSRFQNQIATQRSGCGLERRSSGVSKLSHGCGSERYAACSDADYGGHHRADGCGEGTACIRLSLRSGTGCLDAPHGRPGTLTVWMRRSGLAVSPDGNGGRTPRSARSGSSRQSGPA